MANGDEKAIFDWDDFLFRMGGKKGFCIDLIGIFQKQVTTKLDELSLHIGKGDFEQVGFVAHSLKGISLNVSAGSLGKRAEELELCARTANPSGVGALFQRLQKEFSDFQARVAPIMKEAGRI